MVEAGEGIERPVIEVTDLTFGYGREVVLDHVDLVVRERDFLAVLGPNGGGKSTLLKVILGLLRPWAGRVELYLRRRRGAIGYVPQFADFDRNFPLDVQGMVMMGRLGLRGLLHPYSRADRAAVTAMLERFGLLEQAHEQIGDLSGGQLQRALIARAVVSNPEVLLLDEPLASVDAESRDVLLETLGELNKHIPIMLVTHDLTLLAELVKQIACINRKLYYHESGELSAEVLEEVYGCPVEVVAHGVPHRVLAHHDHDHHHGNRGRGDGG